MCKFKVQGNNYTRKHSMRRGLVCLWSKIHMNANDSAFFIILRTNSIGRVFFKDVMVSVQTGCDSESSDEYKQQGF